MPLLILLILVGSAAWAEHFPFLREPWQLQVDDTPNKWDYEWPFDHLPAEFKGFVIKDSPKYVRGGRHNYWGRDTLLEDEHTGVVVSIRCNGIYRSNHIQPSPFYEPQFGGGVQFKLKPFMGLKAAMGEEIDSASSSHKIYFVFRRGDVVFKMTAKGRIRLEAEEALLNVASAIVKHNDAKKESSK